MRARAPLLWRAIAAQPEPPCIAFDCQRVARCAASGAACSAFEAYALSGKVTAPTPDTATMRWLRDGEPQA